MAIIKCIECNHDVSEFADTCPNCGCPVSVSKTLNQKDENQRYSVIISECKNNKVRIIQVIRNITGLGLSESKKIADELSFIKVNCTLEEANNIKKLIELEEGAVQILPYNALQEKDNNKPICLKCGCTEFVPLRRKFSLLTGFATNKVDMVCKNCGAVRK